MPKSSLPEKLILTLLATPLAIPLLQSIAMLAGHAGVTWPWTITGSLFGRTLLFQGFVLCAVAAYAMLALRDARYRPFLTRTHGWFLALFAVLVLTALTGHDTRLSFWSDAERAEGLAFLAHVGAYLFLLSWAIRDAERFRWFLRVAVGIALGTLALLTIDALQQHRALLSADTWRYQATALLGNPNFFAQWVLLVLVAHTASLLHTNPHPLQLPLPAGRGGTIFRWCVAAVFLGYLGLVASSTALGLAVLVLAVVGWRTHRMATYGVVLAFLLAALAVTLLRGTGILNTIVQALWDSLIIRWHIWTSGVATVFTHAPLIGYGWGNTDLVWNDLPRDVFAVAYSPYSQYRYDRMHNLLLELLVAGGVLACAIGTAVWGRLSILLVQRARRDRTATHAALAVGIVLAYLLWNFDSLMGYVLTSVVLMGAILALDEPRREFRLPTTDYRLRVLSAIGTVCIAAVALGVLVIQPLRASASLMRAEHLLAVTEAQHGDRDAGAILDAHAGALRVRHPYDMHAKDVLDSMMRLAALPILTDTQRSALRTALLTTADHLRILHPRNPHLTHRTAWIHARFRNAPEEIAALEATVALAPTSGPLRFQLAQAYLRAQRHDDARTIIEVFLRERIFTDPATFLLGLLDIWQGNPAGGRHNVGRALITYSPTTAEWQQLTAAQRATGIPDADIIAWYTRLIGYAIAPDGVRDAVIRLQNL